MRLTWLCTCKIMLTFLSSSIEGVAMISGSVNINSLKKSEIGQGYIDFRY